jgi:ankyrin repeat protein
VKALLERGADASLADDMGMTAVQAASRNGHVGVAKILRGHSLRKIKLTGSRGKNGKP